MMFSGHRLCFPVYSSSVMYPVTSSVTSCRRHLGHSCPSRLRLRHLAYNISYALHYRYLEYTEAVSSYSQLSAM
jgi:hypothetical protein